MNQEVIQLRLRLPADLHDYLKRSAAKDDRSINSETIALLKEARNARESQHPDPEES
jgi:hypothetical protein